MGKLHLTLGSLLRGALGVLTLGALLGPGCTVPNTGVIVTVLTDLTVPGELEEFDLRVARDDNQLTKNGYYLAGGSDVATAVLPGTFAIYADDAVVDQEITVNIDISSRGPAGEVLRGATVTLVKGETLSLIMALSRSCLGKPCEPDSTCIDGQCRARTAADLPRYTGDPDDAARSIECGSFINTETGMVIDRGLDCGAGRTCREGRCIEFPAGECDQTCGGGEGCSGDGICNNGCCAPAPRCEMGSPCDAANACPSGQRCVDTVSCCFPETCENESCDDRGRCPSGRLCFDDRCCRAAPDCGGEPTWDITHRCPAGYTEAIDHCCVRSTTCDNSCVSGNDCPTGQVCGRTSCCEPAPACPGGADSCSGPADCGRGFFCRTDNCCQAAPDGGPPDGGPDAGDGGPDGPVDMPQDGPPDLPIDMPGDVAQEPPRDMRQDRRQDPPPPFDQINNDPPVGDGSMCAMGSCGPGNFCVAGFVCQQAQGQPTGCCVPTPFCGGNAACDVNIQCAVPGQNCTSGNCCMNCVPCGTGGTDTGFAPPPPAAPTPDASVGCCP